MKPNFDPAIEECIKEARANLYMLRTSRHTEYKPYCDRLFAYAASEQSDYLFAQAYYCMMQYYACVNDYINTVSCAMEGIKYQQNTQEYELVARSYNMLGIFTASTGNGSQAVDYYLSSIDYCNQYHFDHVHAMAASNLADVFHRSLVYNRALYYYEEAEKYFLKDPTSPEPCVYLDALNNLLCNKGHCLLSIGQLENANECGRKILHNLELIQEQGGEYILFTTHVYLAVLAYANQDMDLMNHHLDIALSDFGQLEK